mmetsp:Transcript_37995/g.119675  ORF Transcript_37995/g.119675 Transcript_37995/m.119675 type:complete len:280 (+) Transcript_37995:519-1358(+)
MGIPMPGHPVGGAEVDGVRADTEALDELVQQHDILFLLTDTRESRWLPTLLAAARRKLAVTAALGFDTFLVMRHGLPPPAEEAAALGAGGLPAGYEQAAPAEAAAPPPPPPPRPRLGCYFCNDVVAPANSMTRRTLDQQCTVSRPGLAMVASALAVELAVTVLHHEHGAEADADVPAEAARAATCDESPLGVVPHQIRGALSFFRTDCMLGRAFGKCTACSATVTDAYAARGFDFLLDAFNGGDYLEELTGLAQMHREAEAALEDVGFFEDEEDEAMSE